MSQQEPTDVSGRLRCALELFELGEAMMLERLRREDPTASEQELALAMSRWLRTRPGAEHGDAAGIVRPVARDAR